MKWEYLIYNTYFTSLSETADAAGAKGWELVAVTYGGDGTYTLFFKRLPGGDA
jgi:hypothetical protein